MSSFEIGDNVMWTSQAQGTTKTKRGVIVEVVPAGRRPDEVKCAQLYRGAGVGWGRSHVSYVVKVGSRLYWPRANSLRRLGGPTCPNCGHPLEAPNEQ